MPPDDLADALYQHLLDRFPADRDYPRGALYVEGMPPPVASLLGRTLDRWLEHELDALESRWFDFEDPAVRAARAELIVALGRTARVPRGAWAETLRYAVGAVVRHLTTPAPALTDATFEGVAEPLPTEIVRTRLHTFEAYPYLPEIADAYLKQKRPETVDPDGLSQLLVRIDRRVTGEYSTEDWLRLLGPLFTLARRIPEVKGLPTSLLVDFFAAKGQEEAVAALREMGVRELDESALHDLLARALVVTEAGADAEAEPAQSGETAPEQVENVQETALPTPEEPDDEIEDEAEILPPPAAEELPAKESEPEEVIQDDVARGDVADRLSDGPAVMPAPPSEPEPLWKRFAGQAVGPTVETSVPEDQARPVFRQDPIPDPPQEDEAPLWRRFFSGVRRPGKDAPTEGREARAGTAAELASLEDVEARVLGQSGGRQRRRYVRDLFRGDEHAYLSVLTTLEACDSWPEASRIIASDVFKRFGVDIYSATAVDFTDAVSARFAE